MPGYVAQVHDEHGHEVPNGTVGRLAIKGPTGCKYLDDERQSVYVQAGWNYPGDAYWMDDDGYLWYVARTDDMIVSAGYNVSGPEVEDVLLAHPDVREAAVVAKHDPLKETNVVKAFVVLEGSTTAHDAKAERCESFAGRGLPRSSRRVKSSLSQSFRARKPAKSNAISYVFPADAAGSIAVASISTSAPSSSKPATTTSAIAG